METVYISSPSNISTTPITIVFDRTTEIDWILPILFNILLILATLWLLISLVHYGIKTKQWSNNARSTDILSSGVIYSCVVACAVMCMFRYIASLVYMNVGFEKDRDEVCESAADAGFCAYAFVLLFVALFLWFRQRAFYAHKLLKVNYNKLIRCLSYISIIVIIVYGVFVIALNTPPNRYLSNGKGCILKQDSSLSFGYWVAAVVGILFYNITLLGLLYYALTKVNSYQRAVTLKLKEEKSDSSSQETSSKDNGYQQRIKNQPHQKPAASKQDGDNSIRRSHSSSQKIKVVLQKTLVFATLSILFDIFLQVFAIYIANPQGNRRTSSVLFDANAFLNLMFVILSFTSYRNMITSPCSLCSSLI